jgi:hypothetical protein
VTRRAAHVCAPLLLICAGVLLSARLRAEAVQLGVRGEYWHSLSQEGGYLALLWLRLRPDLLFRTPLPVLSSADAADIESPVGPIEGESGDAAEFANLADSELAAGSPGVARPASPSESASSDRSSSDFAARLLVRVRMLSGSAGERLESLASRSRSAAWLPELRLQAGRSADQSLRYSPTADDPDRWLQAGGADLRYQAQATWTLDRLIFSRDELGVERFRMQREREMERRAKQALAAFFTWQKLGVKLAGLLEEERRAELELEREQARITLDLLSAGWFGRNLPR